MSRSQEPRATRTGTPRAAERRQLLSSESAAVGKAWARMLCDATRGEGRDVTGGWPGTMLEARARVSVLVDGKLEREGMRALTPTELTAATSIAYAQARYAWLEVAKVEGRALARRGDALD